MNLRLPLDSGSGTYQGLEYFTTYGTRKDPKGKDYPWQISTRVEFSLVRKHILITSLNGEFKCIHFRLPTIHVTHFQCKLLSTYTIILLHLLETWELYNNLYSDTITADNN